MDDTKKAEQIVEGEKLIRSHIETIDRLKEEVKVKSDMVKDSYEKDTSYQTLDARAKEVRKEATKFKSQVLQMPTNKKLKEELKEMKADLNDRREALSVALVQYTELSGSTQLELFDGLVGTIVLRGSIVPKIR